MILSFCLKLVVLLWIYSVLPKGYTIVNIASVSDSVLKSESNKSINFIEKFDPSHDSTQRWKEVEVF